MKLLCKYLTGLSLSVAIVLPCAAGDNSTGYEIILLAGQSNMAGRGLMPSPLDADGAPSENIKMWHPSQGILTAKDPIIHSEPLRPGVSMGMTFAKAYLERLKDTGFPNRKILLVGAAWGGTGFAPDASGKQRWLATQDATVGGDLYRTAVQRANSAIGAALAAEPTSKFAGILWHQGESDLIADNVSSYAVKHTALMKALRTNIRDADNAAVVVGEMTPCMWAQCESSVGSVSAEDRATMLNYLHNIQNVLPNSAWVSSAGLGGNGAGDKVHFNTPSQRELGRRYFSKFWEASHNLPSPAIDLKIHNGEVFNVGNLIDFDPTYSTSTTSVRVNGNVAVQGSVTLPRDGGRGYVAGIGKSTGKLVLGTSASLFNGSYTKMAWVKLNSNSYRAHLLSGEGPTQSHFLFASGGQFLAAGHSSPTNPVNVYVQQATVVPLNTWLHVAVGYAAPVKTMTLYVNGVAVDSTTGVQPATQATGTSTLTMSGFGSRTDFGLDGYMNSNKVWGKALSATDIKKLYDFEKVSQKGYGIQ
ncbi:MAG: sialate O-acetylesterase [Pseudomonadota bacterium]